MAAGARVRAWCSLERLELAVGLALAAALAAAHGVLLGHGGCLWRDEVNSQGLAGLPSLGEVAANLKEDSVPMLWLLVLRGWNAVVAHHADLPLRALGMLVGLALLAVLWRAGRRLAQGPPLLALVLFGGSAALLRVGDSLRAYGLGTLLLLLVLDRCLALLDRPDLKNGLLAALWAVLAVQTLYHNVVLVAILGLAAGLAALAAGNRRAVLALVAMELAAAASMLPYRPAVAAIGQYAMLVQWPTDFGLMFTYFSNALGLPAAVAALLLWLGAVIAGVAALVRRRGAGPDPRGLFLVLALAGVGLGYALFLRTLRYAMHPWYFFAGLGLLSVLVDAQVRRLGAGTPWVRWSRLGLVAALAAVLAGPMADGVRTRYSGIGQIAGYLQAKAGPDDLVVVNPWFLGVTFDRYYHGRAPWMSLPDLPDHRTHRYDLFKRKVQEADPLAPDLGRIEAALKAGRKVWVVGTLLPYAKGTIPSGPPPPSGPYTWNEAIFRAGWTRRLTWLVDQRTDQLLAIEVLPARPVSYLEDPQLYLATGWRSSTTPK